MTSCEKKKMANLITVMLLKCPNNALFTGTWNMLAKEAVQCAGACAAHYIASFPFDNLTPTRPTLACLTLETIL
jgi:hypothetical protein